MFGWVLKTRQSGVFFATVYLILVHSLRIERVIRHPSNVLDNSFIMSQLGNYNTIEKWIIHLACT